MIELADLPAVNAVLNSIAFVLLMSGYACIRKKRVTAHKRFMIAAFGVSILFLVSYLTHRYYVGETKFAGTGWIRPAYFVLLITHVVLAATVPILASMTLYRGLKGQFDKHRRLARWTFPIWVYVSITGVMVYLMLFQLYKPADSV